MPALGPHTGSDCGCRRVPSPAQRIDHYPGGPVWVLAAPGHFVVVAEDEETQGADDALISPYPSPSLHRKQDGRQAGPGGFRARTGMAQRAKACFVSLVGNPTW